MNAVLKNRPEVTGTSRSAGHFRAGSVAFAAAPSQSPGHPPIPRRCEIAWAAPINAAAAEAYGMTEDEIVVGLHAGATLKELADNPLEVQALAAALRGRVNEKIDKALADGLITEEQAAMLRAVYILIYKGGPCSFQIEELPGILGMMGRARLRGLLP